MTYDIFISYSRKDTAIAEKIMAALERAGYRCFIDRSGISGGADFPSVLAKAILDSRLVLLLASQNSYQSEYTRKELVFTVNNRGSGAIFPLIIDGHPLPKDLEFMLSNINWRVLSDHYRIEPELVEDIHHRLENPEIREVFRTPKLATVRHKGIAAKTFAIIGIAGVLTAGVLFIREKQEDKRLRGVASQMSMEFSGQLDSVERKLSLADSIRNLRRPEELFRQEFEAIAAASEWLNRADSVRLESSDNPYAEFNDSRYTALSLQRTAKLDSLFSVWKPYALNNWKSWQHSGDPIDRIIARQYVANALILHPEDAELQEIANKLDL